MCTKQPATGNNSVVILDNEYRIIMNKNGSGGRKGRRRVS